MKVTDRTKKALATRRQAKKLMKDGYEYVDHKGGKLWEIDRGCRKGKKIVAVEISIDGLGLWVKIA